PNGRFPSWPCDPDPMRVYRPLLEARDMGFEAVRVWLCENGEGVIVTDEHVTGVHPALIESVKVLQECAHLAGLRVYWSLLDGNTWARENDDLTHSVLTDPDQTKRFAEYVVAPLARVFDRDLLVGVEVVNEPEAMTAECRKDGPSVPWTTLGTAIRTVGDAV